MARPRQGRLEELSAVGLLSAGRVPPKWALRWPRRSPEVRNEVRRVTPPAPRIKMPPRSSTCRGLGPDLTRRSDVAKGTCSVEGCSGAFRTRGMCNKHYKRWLNHGHPAELRHRIFGSVLHRVLSCIVPGENCWDWSGHLSEGYPRIGMNGRLVLVHRWWYAFLNGPIPDGLTIDHACHNGTGCPGGPTCPHRRCLNPSHLEAVTLRENNRRSSPHGHGMGRVNAAKTHCKRGHLFDKQNTIPTGRQGQWRACLECRRTRYQRTGK